MRKKSVWPSKYTINTDWPFRVAIRADLIRGSGYARMELFCREREVCKRKFEFYNPDTSSHQIVYCFADEQDAAEFAESFEGTVLPPRTIPRWPVDLRVKETIKGRS